MAAADPLKPACQGKGLPSRKAAFRRTLLDWFAREARDYPWRRTSDPYAILVSEVMLQQTRIATVLEKGYYTRFLQTFPNPATLAAASDEQILKAWEGLGYYRRVRLLRETARTVHANHQDRFPPELDTLLALPGIGRYTAGALRAFAFNLPAVLVDGNVARVLTRLFDDHSPIDSPAGQNFLWQTAANLADDQNPRAYHAALMELGQRVCRPGPPSCLECPVASFCRSRNPASLPVKRASPTIEVVSEHALWARDAAGRLLLHRESARRRQGLWKLPTRPAASLAHLPLLAEHPYTITRYRVLLHVHLATQVPPPDELEDGEIWTNPEDLPNLAMPAPFRRVIERLIAET